MLAKITQFSKLDYIVRAKIRRIFDGDTIRKCEPNEYDEASQEAYHRP